MRKIGLLLVLCGSALFVLPIVGVSLPLFASLGSFRTMAAVVLIIMGTGFVAFSAPRI